MEKTIEYWNKLQKKSKNYNWVNFEYIEPKEYKNLWNLYQQLGVIATAGINYKNIYFKSGEKYSYQCNIEDIFQEELTRKKANWKLLNKKQEKATLKEIFNEKHRGILIEETEIIIQMINEIINENQ